jgi:hypothetical protein
MKKLLTILTLTTLLIPTTLYSANNSCALRTGGIYRSSVNPEIYFITENCTKQLFRSEADILTHVNTLDKVTLTDELTLRFIPNDVTRYAAPKETPTTGGGSSSGSGSNTNSGGSATDRSSSLIVQDGSIIKSRNKPEIFIVINNVKYHIKDMNTFTELGIPTRWIEIVSESTLNTIPSGTTLDVFAGAPLMSQAAPNFILFKDKNSPHVYRVEPSTTDPKYQVLRRIANENVLRKLQYRLDRLPTVQITPIEELSLVSIGGKTVFYVGSDLSNNSTISYKGTFAEILKERQTAKNDNAYARNEKYDDVYFEYPRKYKIVRGFSYLRAFRDEYQVALLTPKDEDSALYLSVAPLAKKSTSYTTSEREKLIDQTHEYPTGFEHTTSATALRTWNTEIKTHTTFGRTKITKKESLNGLFETRITFIYKNHTYTALITHTSLTGTELEDTLYFIANTFRET